jgi:hypothetical protein
LTIRELIKARWPLQLTNLLPQVFDSLERFVQLLHTAAPFDRLHELARLLSERGLDMTQ